MPYEDLIDRDTIAVWSGAHVFTAELGVEAPPDATSDFGVGWVHLGEISDDGIAVGGDPAFNTLGGFNTLVPARYIPTGHEMTVGFQLLQWTRDSIEFANGGGTWTDVAASVGPPAVAEHVLFEPPEVVDRPNYRQLALHLEDATGVLRRFIPKGLVTTGGGFSTAKADGSPMACTFSIVQPSGSPPWYDRLTLTAVEA